MRRFIGDVHSKFDRYVTIIDVPYETIQVGDFGHGFNTVPELNTKDRHIRGNHDDPALARAHPNFIQDGLCENNTMFIGGAKSSDRYKRVEGKDWWNDEELSFPEMFPIGYSYADYMPETVVSHDCPLFLVSELNSGHCIPTNTNGFLQNLFEIHKPKLWVFGHHHKSFDKTILGTRFICLNELEYIDI